MNDSVTIIVPAFNEEKNIRGAIQSALSAAKHSIREYEIVVIDDGSTDRTGEIIDHIAKTHANIRIIHHTKNMGFGYSIKEGIAKARKTYVVGFPGDNDTSGASLQHIIRERNAADIIISYTVDSSRRSWKRRLVSRAFVLVMNTLFRLRLRYFNGSFMCKTKRLQAISLSSRGFAIYAEAKVRLLKQGATYKEVPFEHIGRKYGRSKAVTMQSVFDTIYTVMALLRDHYLPHIVRDHL